MRSTKCLLIGGGLASGQAAKQLRERDGRGTITLVGEELSVPYDRPPLSKEFLRGEKPRDALFFDPAQYFHDHDVGLVLRRRRPAAEARRQDRQPRERRSHSIRESPHRHRGAGRFISNSPAGTARRALPPHPR